jgi:serine/threonine protein kinase/tetratricopeptide (TPR) repeat protein
MLRVDKALWHAVSPLLERALGLSAADRATLLSDVSAQRPDVARVLARLLEAHDRVLGSSFLESWPAIDDDTVPSLAGQTVGAYTLDTPLGMGGMGTVWRARRSDGRFEGFVALKLLNLALVGHGGDERFRREGTLLARLTHPNIARLLDAGVTATGQPYLVLEYIEGTRIDQFANDRQLSPVKRLELFLQVADASAHAHANLIVHRDIKPSNVLVTNDGQVKLLDFGIGKLLEGEASSELPTKLTRAGGGALTPEYAAPEQLTGEAVSTATDIYALGVLLFVLLTKQHPAGASVTSPADLMKAIVETESPRASDVATDPRLRRLMRGDLDTIIAKSLKKRPADRYISVTALADDLRRHLRDEPIGARPDSRTYRAAKFVRRHRWPVAAALVVFGLLSAGLFVANRERQIAERRFGQLRHLSDQVFSLDDRIQNLQGATDARHALVAASLQYLEGLAADAYGDLDLLQEVGNGYWRVARIQGVPVGLNLGDFAKAEVSLRKADANIEAVLAARPRDSRALERSAAIAQDRMIVAQSEGRDSDSLVHARKAAERVDVLLAQGGITDTQRTSLIGVYSNVAMTYLNVRDSANAVRHARRTLELARSQRVARLTSNALSVLSNALRAQGDLDGALTAIREAHEIADRSTYENEALRMFDRYAVLLREGFILGEDRGVSLERPAEAIVPLRESFDMHEAGARRDPKDYTSRIRVATSGRELGDILRWRDAGEALAVYDVALGRLDEIKDNVPARRDKALVLANSSYALRRLHRTAEARRRVDDALHILKETKDYPSDRIALDSKLKAVLQALADQRAAEGQVMKAIEEYDALLAKVMAAKPDVDNDLRTAYDLSLLYEDFGRLQRLAGATAQAEALDAKRRSLWTHWNGKLPNNPFVLRRLAALTAS